MGISDLFESICILVLVKIIFIKIWQRLLAKSLKIIEKAKLFVFFKLLLSL